MYIFISDRFLINDKTLNYFTCKGDYLTKAIAKCPVLETIESNEIDKVIVLYEEYIITLELFYG